MKIGMLWYDDDKQRTLEEKVRRAAEYFREKYGRLPDLCLLNPATLNGGPAKIAKIELRTKANILLYHFWLGTDDNGSGAA